MDSRSYYLSRLERAAAVPAAQRGADVRGLLEHQRLLDEAYDIFCNQVEIPLVAHSDAIEPVVNAVLTRRRPPALPAWWRRKSPARSTAGRC